MSYRPYYIEVSGNITAVEGKNYAQSFTAGACRDEVSDSPLPGVYHDDKHAITGDLILNKKKRAVPYARYFAHGAVGIKEGAQKGVDLSCAPGFIAAFAYFYEYVTEISAALERQVCEEVKDLYYNGLYISAFSVLELFLCDFLLCGVFSKESYYQKALVTLEIDNNADQYSIEKSIKDTVYKQVFHQFDKIEKIFKAILGFGFPDYRDLKRLIHRRHNIVHRFALSNQDRMTVCDASYNDVDILIKTIVFFVERMRDELKKVE